MFDNGRHLRNREIREFIAVIDEKVKPTLILKNGIYLNVFTKKWLKAHVWIYKERIIYVGDKLPTDESYIEMIDCEDKYLVPGYIEPHANSYQLYNPEIIAKQAADYGTTTLVNDNLMWFFLLNKKKAFSLIDELNELPMSMYWRARYDSQTAFKEDENSFKTKDVLDWLNHPSVIQGGPLTSWERLLEGDDRLLYWIQKTRRLGKTVEGHFPLATEEELNKMKLFGVRSDHESQTAEDVIKRLELGYHVSLRHSSHHPDLSVMIKNLIENEMNTWDRLSLTTDGSTPSFYEHGLINECIEVAIENGVPIADAYAMASYNAAVQVGISEDQGSISPGKKAHINILSSKENPHPSSVLAKGDWIIKENIKQDIIKITDWEKHGLSPLKLDWDLDLSDFQFSLPLGIKLENDVITKPYAITEDISADMLPEETDTAYLLLIDREGKWRVNTTIKGFTKRLGGLASSYSTSGDIVMIGKSKRDMMYAWTRMKEIGGGIVLVHQGEIIFELPLKLAGMMFDGNMAELIEKDKALKVILIDFGYLYKEPIYSIFFLTSTHLPYIRLTQQGTFDSSKKTVFFPANIR